MRTRLLIVAACLLVVATGPAFAQNSSPGKTSDPKDIGGKTLSQWVEATRSQDPSIRETAVRAIPYFGKSARSAALPLAARLKDPDAACRVHAALALSYLAEVIPDEEVAEVVKALADRADNDGQAVVRLNSVGALGSFGPKAVVAIPSLVNRIHDVSSWELRQAVVNSLASVATDKKFGPDGRAVTAICTLLGGDEKSARVRTAAVIALGNMGRPQDKEFKLATQVLQKASKDPDKGVAIWAAVALMNIDKVTEEGLSEVANYLKVKDVMLKVTAARALEALGKESAKSRIPDIIELLGDKDPLVVATAIDVLGGFGDAAKNAVPDLEKILQNKEEREYFRQAARSALEQITGVKRKPLADGGRRPDPGSSSVKPPDPTEVGGKTLAQWIQQTRNPDPGTREAAIQAIPYFGKSARSAASALIARLRDTDVACKVHAALALSALADYLTEDDAIEAVKVLAERVETDAQAIVRFQAALALGAFPTKGSAAIPSLVKRIHDTSSWEVRQAVINSLATVAGNDKLGPDALAVNAIANHLLSGEEKSGEVRMAAVIALGTMGRPALEKDLKLAVQALHKSLNDRDKAVAIWSAVALMAVDKVTPEGLAAVAKHLKGKDVTAKVTAARALGAMGKEARPKIPDVIAQLTDEDPIVLATAIDVLAGFGSYARDAVPALKKVIDKKDQTDYFKEAARYAIEQIDGRPKK